MKTALRAAPAYALLLLILALPRPAHAYLDPQTGAMVFSAVVAFAATVAMGIQSYWHRIVSALRRKAPPSEEPARPERESPGP